MKGKTIYFLYYASVSNIPFSKITCIKCTKHCLYIKLDTNLENKGNKIPTCINEATLNKRLRKEIFRFVVKPKSVDYIYNVIDPDDFDSFLAFFRSNQ